MRALITGASGFVGRAILKRLSSERQFELRGIVRRRIDDPIKGVSYFQVAELGQVVEWAKYRVVLPSDAQRGISFFVRSEFIDWTPHLLVN